MNNQEMKNKNEEAIGNLLGQVYPKKSGSAVGVEPPSDLYDDLEEMFLQETKEWQSKETNTPKNRASFWLRISIAAMVCLLAGAAVVFQAFPQSWWSGNSGNKLAGQGLREGNEGKRDESKENTVELTKAAKSEKEKMIAELQKKINRYLTRLRERMEIVREKEGKEGWSEAFVQVEKEEAQETLKKLMKELAELKGSPQIQKYKDKKIFPVGHGEKKNPGPKKEDVEPIDKEAQLRLGKIALRRAELEYEKLINGASKEEVAVVQAKVDAERKKVEANTVLVNDAKAKVFYGQGGNSDVLKTQAALADSEAALQKAKSQLKKLIGGPGKEVTELAKLKVDEAKIKLEQIKKGRSINRITTTDFSSSNLKNETIQNEFEPETIFKIISNSKRNFRFQIGPIYEDRKDGAGGELLKILKAEFVLAGQPKISASDFIDRFCSSNRKGSIVAYWVLDEEGNERDFGEWLRLNLLKQHLAKSPKTAAKEKKLLTEEVNDPAKVMMDLINQKIIVPEGFEILEAIGSDAASPKAVSPAISDVLEILSESELTFLRQTNDKVKEYSGSRMRFHVWGKYVLAKTPEVTAEQFIDRFCTKSSIHDTPYKVRLSNNKEVELGSWLKEELKMLLANKKITQESADNFLKQFRSEIYSRCKLLSLDPAERILVFEQSKGVKEKNIKLQWRAFVYLSDTSKNDCYHGTILSLKNGLVAIALVNLDSVGLSRVFKKGNTYRLQFAEPEEIVMNRERTLYFEIGGRISKILVNKDQVVKKGQLLVELESNVSRANVKIAEAKYEKVKTNLAVILEDTKAFPKYQIMNLQADMKTALAELELTKAELEKFKLHSPVNGVVREIFWMEGEVIIEPAGKQEIIRLEVIEEEDDKVKSK